MWARQHIKFVLAPDSNPFGITQNLHQISRGSGNIYLIGYSAGGTAVIRYLTELKESRSSNPGIAGAVAIDTPLQGDLGFHKNQAPDFVAGNRGFDRFRIGIRLEKIIGDCPPLAVPHLEDRLAGLGTWAQDQGIRLLQVSYADDVFNPRVQIGDISQVVVKTDENYANKSIQDKHGYLLTGPGSYGLISGLFAQGVLK